MRFRWRVLRCASHGLIRIDRSCLRCCFSWVSHYSKMRAVSCTYARPVKSVIPGGPWQTHKRSPPFPRLAGPDPQAPCPQSMHFFSFVPRSCLSVSFFGKLYLAVVCFPMLVSCARFCVSAPSARIGRRSGRRLFDAATPWCRPWWTCSSGSTRASAPFQPAPGGGWVHMEAYTHVCVGSRCGNSRQLCDSIACRVKM